MGYFVPVLNGSCSCPPMGRDLGPNPARYIEPYRPGTKIFQAVACLGRVFFPVLRAGPLGPAQIYTYRQNRAPRSTLGSYIVVEIWKLSAHGAHIKSSSFILDLTFLVDHYNL
jgi:hypothetical protein